MDVAYKDTEVICFDMDETLTPSKGKLSLEQYSTLRALSQTRTVVFVSGAVFEQMQKQLLSFPAVYLAQNGNHAVDARTSKTRQIWNNSLSGGEIKEVEEHIKKLSQQFRLKVDGTTVQYRGAQISFSIYGHDAPIEEKKDIDPTKQKRWDMLSKVPFESGGLTVKIGGTTCLDYTSKSGTKGENVNSILQWLNVPNGKSLYIGDALNGGGNDETVKGVCDTKEVASVEDTYNFINSKLLTVVVVSGGFDPVHIGHIRLFQEAKKLGDKLIVILNNDNWLVTKKGVSFMSEDERKEILLAISEVDEVVITSHKKDDHNRSVVRELDILRPDIFANGGDRKLKNTPEENFCVEHGIETVYGVGGGKVQSSSWLISKSKKYGKNT